MYDKIKEPLYIYKFFIKGKNIVLPFATAWTLNWNITLKLIDKKAIFKIFLLGCQMIIYA